MSYHEQRNSLKVVVLGNEGVGKTSLIQQLLRSDRNDSISSSSAESAHIEPLFHSSSNALTDPTTVTEENSSSSSRLAEPTGRNEAKDTLVQLNMYEWELPSKQKNGPDCIEKLNVWDFSGHQQFHAVQEMFFTPETLYVVVWDMAAQDIQPLQQERCCGADGGLSMNCGSGPPLPARCSFVSQPRCTSSCSTAFRLDYDSDSDDGCEQDMYNQEEIRRLKRAIDQDIDEKVQSWIDRIQARVPGATILPVATFADRFWTMFDTNEATKRCNSLKERLICHENCRYQDLKLRIQSASSGEGEKRKHKETCCWVNSLLHRPRILFGSSQEDGQLLPHQVCAKDGTGIGCFREFLVQSANLLAKAPNAVNCSPMTRTVLRDTCRSMKSHFKIVQAQYFLKQYCEDSQQEVATALESLHQCGELCYFHCQGSGFNADLVILDPAWMVESVNFVLRNGLNQFSTSNVASHLDNSVYSVYQSFYREIRSLWKNRPQTKLGLELAEQISSDALDRVFDYYASILARYDVIVPLTFHGGSNGMLLPSSLLPRVFHNECCDSSCKINCPLLHLGAAGVFSRSVCHSLTFLDPVPASLMGRILIHVMKVFGSQDFKDLRVTIEEFSCWKDSYHIKISTGDHRLITVQSFLLHAPEENSPSYAVSCKNMCVTCIEVSNAKLPCDNTKQVCHFIRRGMQYALDEMPGVEYRDEGICPGCLINKAVGAIGTWTFPKIRSVLEDKEPTIRCQNGHCVDMDLVQGLITCELETPKSDFSCCVPTTTSLTIDAINARRAVPDDGFITPNSSMGGSRSFSEEICKIKPCTDVRRSKTLPASSKWPVPIVVETIPRSTSESPVDDSNDEDIVKFQTVKKVIQTYESSTKKRFFGMKKPKLVLSGLQLQENHIPLMELIGTPLGHNLQHLSLSKNLFKSLPPSLVVSLPNLKSFDLSNCCISDLPQQWDLPKLKKLNLSNNRLKSFPGEQMLVGMPELEELNLSVNEIKTVTISCQSQVLRKLKVLDLSTNQISSLPNDFVRLSSLKVFDIQHNPIKKVPIEIVSSMNNFLVEEVQDRPSKVKNTTSTWSDHQRAKKSIWSSKGSSSGDESSTEVRKLFCRPVVKQVSLSRSTQNTIPVEDLSERCENLGF
ncbi:Miro domain containing protein [Nitzschia inconspicua]|uniref:Miro domain containing protein n=1 Tax=Nitzschia inconspicua TaxID=303405 RepID=A0A9K3KHK0_9STRA|nr:Miro domain containing protein [Nitzschia inconspicua]